MYGLCVVDGIGALLACDVLAMTVFDCYLLSGFGQLQCSRLLFNGSFKLNDVIPLQDRMSQVANKNITNLLFGHVQIKRLPMSRDLADCT